MVSLKEKIIGIIESDTADLSRRREELKGELQSMKIEIDNIEAESKKNTRLLELMNNEEVYPITPQREYHKLAKLLSHLAAFNRLDGALVQLIGEAYVVNAKSICQREGITYDIALKPLDNTRDVLRKQCLYLTPQEAINLLNYATSDPKMPGANIDRIRKVLAFISKGKVQGDSIIWSLERNGD